MLKVKLIITGAKLFILLAVFVCQMAIAQISWAGLSEAWYSDALEKYKEKDFHGCVQCATKAVEYDEEYAIAFFLRGLCKSKLKNYQSAVDDYDETIWLHTTKKSKLSRSKEGWTYNNRGYSYERLEKYDEAISDYTKALDIGRETSDKKLIKYALNNWASTCNDLGKHSEAISKYKTSIELNNDNYAAYNGLAWSYCLSSQLELAYQNVRISLERKPDYTSAIHTRGRILLDMGRYDEAIADLNKYIEKRKQDTPWGFIDRAHVYFFKNEKVMAAKDVERAQQLVNELKGVPGKEYKKRLSDLSFKLSNEIDHADGKNAPQNIQMSDSQHANQSVSGTNSHNENISILLNNAKINLKANRLTTPKGLNALESYREVLKLDPDNDEANGGLKQIVGQYATLAERSIKAGSLPKAKQYLDRAETVIEGDDRILAIRVRLDQLQTTEVSPPTPEKVAATKPQEAKPAVQPSQPHVGSNQAGFRSRLFVLSIGVSKYQEPGISLQYASRDAEALARALRQQPLSIYEEVRVKVLTDAQVTRNSIMSNIQSFLGQAVSTDVAMIFVAGHGIKRTGTESYYFLPYPASGENLTIEGLRWSDFEEEIRLLKNRIRNVIIVLDTCHAGALKVSMRSIQRAQDLSQQFKTSGMYTLAAAQPGEEAEEAGQWKHGAFTFAMLEALKGKADVNKDKRVDVIEMFQYVERRVASLTKGRQHPHFRMGGGSLPIMALQ